MNLSTSIRHPFQTLDLVIFDFDGVVADSEMISLSSLQSVLRDSGVDLPLTEVRQRFMGKSLGQIMTETAGLNPGGDWEDFGNRWYAVLFERFETELTPISGIVGLLERINAEGLPYCIASSGSLERIEFALNAMGLTRQFPHVFSAEHVKRGKPAPDLFLHAAKTLGARPERCLVIEDSPFGIQAGRSAGMHTVGFLGGSHLQGLQESHRHMLMEQGAHHIVSSLDEITFRPIVSS